MLGEFHRSLGLELSGSKNDRSALAILDYYPNTQRLVLVDVEPKISGESEESTDETLIHALSEAHTKAKHFCGLAVHGPTSLPPHFRPYEGEKQKTHPEIKWMNEVWKKLKPRPKPFAPYLQRPAEVYLRYLSSERFAISDALGSNCAPLAARLHFLEPRLPQPIFEVFPRATLTRLISSLGLPKTLLRDFADLEKGLSTREFFFQHFSKKLPQLFIYEKDLEFMILHLNCFYAFLTAFTQHLIFTKQVETPPRGYPKLATWIYLPLKEIDWNRVFK